MISTRAWVDSALATSTICCWATPRLRTGVPGSSAHAEALEERARVRVQLLPVDDAAAGRLAAEEDVLGRGEVGDEVELLVDGADAEVLGAPRRPDLDLAAGDLDGARVAGGGPGEDAHEGGLAGPVLAEQDVDLARRGGRSRPRRGPPRRGSPCGSRAGAGAALRARPGSRPRVRSLLDSGCRIPFPQLSLSLGRARPLLGGRHRAGLAAALVVLAAHVASAGGGAPAAGPRRVRGPDALRLPDPLPPAVPGRLQDDVGAGRDLRQRPLRVREHRDRPRPRGDPHRPPPAALRDHRQLLVGRAHAGSG